MFYQKNLPVWERTVRLLAALGMGACAANFWGSPAGWTFAAGGVIMAATSLVGFCPMCAMAGRRLEARDQK